ncbi:hypothetical protein SteCoe_6073 [Stentor coeruleus]|uniref:MICOS complex subunit MIC60 n=1 Tax=Stentor coeruleus TaxID=5963 RepID=A0A1R2CQW8_9CILI|nr:hypothetical protein SteCoe_6073 [Stentor coeruleus]
MWTASKRLLSSLKNFPPAPKGGSGKVKIVSLALLLFSAPAGYLYYTDPENFSFLPSTKEASKPPVIVHPSKSQVEFSKVQEKPQIKAEEKHEASVPKIQHSKPEEPRAKVEDLKAKIEDLKAKTEGIKAKAEVEETKSIIKVSKPVELVKLDERNKMKEMLEAIDETIKRQNAKDKTEAEKKIVVEEKKVELPVVIKAEEIKVEEIKVEAKKESLVPIEKNEEKVPNNMSAQEIETFISKLKADMEAEQKSREVALYEKVEKTFLSLLNEFSAKAENKNLSAGSLSAHIEFSKFIVEELQKKYETFIMAYEDRLENLGVKHYDSFIERIKVEKAKWKARMEELQTQYEKDVETKIHERDDNWRKILENEYFEGQKHFEAQTKINEEFAQQEAELRLTHSFKQELDEINRNLKESSEIPRRQVKEIIEKIEEMEKIQDDHYKILTRLIEIHKLHLAIENLQRALQNDQGNLTKDFEAVKTESKNNEIVRAYLEKVKIHYPQIIESGIPKMRQIQKTFIEASYKARRAALVKSNSFWSLVTSRIAINFVPRNVKTVDENDTFSILMRAENDLDSGNLRGALKEIDKLQGLPKEEMMDVAKEIDLRLSINEFIEILSGHSSQVVRQLLSSKVLN